MSHDRNTVEQSELNYVPQKTNFRHPHLHLSSTFTRRPFISPSGLCEPSPPALIKVKEALQIKIMRADVGALSGLSVDLSTHNRLRLNGPGDSRFGVSVYPPPGQSVHTLTPACQRSEQQGSREGTGRGRERGRVSRSKKQRERVFTFLNKVQTPADSNKTEQLLSLLTQANLSSTLEAWLVNMNCNSRVLSTASAEVKSVARLPHSGGCVDYRSGHAGRKMRLWVLTLTHQCIGSVMLRKKE